MDKNDFTIEVHDDTLVVSGEKRFEREASEGRYRVLQCAYGHFHRTIPLPARGPDRGHRSDLPQPPLSIELPTKAEPATHRSIEIKIPQRSSPGLPAHAQRRGAGRHRTEPRGAYRSALSGCPNQIPSTSSNRPSATKARPIQAFSGARSNSTAPETSSPRDRRRRVREFLIIVKVQLQFQRVLTEFAGRSSTVRRCCKRAPVNVRQLSDAALRRPTLCLTAPRRMPVANRTSHERARYSISLTLSRRAAAPCPPARAGVFPARGQSVHWLRS